MPRPENIIYESARVKRENRREIASITSQTKGFSTFFFFLFNYITVRVPLFCIWQTHGCPWLVDFIVNNQNILFLRLVGFFFRRAHRTSINISAKFLHTFTKNTNTIHRYTHVRLCAGGAHGYRSTTTVTHLLWIVWTTRPTWCLRTRNNTGSGRTGTGFSTVCYRPDRPAPNPWCTALWRCSGGCPRTPVFLSIL